MDGSENGSVAPGVASIHAAFANTEEVSLPEDSADPGSSPVAEQTAENTDLACPAKNRSGWRHSDMQVVRNRHGQPVWCQATANELLENHPDWKGCIRRDAFLRRDMLLSPVPGTDVAGEFTPCEISDNDITAAVVWFNKNGFPDATRVVVRESIQAIADKYKIDPLMDWLKSLTWDGKCRLSSWLVRYLGAEESDYISEVGRRWLISAVARALRPGIKADGCLVLEGGQGSGKSTALRILASDRWFGDSLPDLTNKDAALYLRGKWIIEISELSSLGRASFETTKAFISRQEERYRPPYARTEVTEPRRCIFAGTTNQSDYLRDPSGNRRFLPVLTGQIDIEGLSRDRAQLWAEAFTAFQSDEVWWLRDEIAQAASIEQAERGNDDPWIAPILSYCEERSQVATKEILRGALEIPVDRQTQKDSKRVAAILVSNGFQRAGKFTSGDSKGSIRFARAG